MARVDGVSHATVFRVLNEARHVRPAARRAVEDAIRATGYVLNRQARSLAMRRTDTVTAVIVESCGPRPTWPGPLPILRGCARVLTRHGTSMEMLFVDVEVQKTERHRLDRHLGERRVTGLLLVPRCRDAVPARLVDPVGLPMAAYGTPSPAGRQVAHPWVDSRVTAYTVTRGLHRSGRRRIAVITDSPDAPDERERLEGHRAALTDLGVPDEALLVEHGTHSGPGGREAMRRLLGRDRAVDAAVVTSERMTAAPSRPCARGTGPVPVRWPSARSRTLVLSRMARSRTPDRPGTA
ncbi:LacI family DNA-binding transcriptional regulator [Streptomyces sp. T028]|uniref:LacI family DNA-binding transcriptional regulator n=1 Tax=Streptomyces sp. T028 TaxID=3394379 RepID=UPI003A8529E8